MGSGKGEEIVQRGIEVYDQQLRAQLEPGHRGHYVAIDVGTGRYEAAETMLSALQQAQATCPGSVLYLHRIGYPAAVRIGAASRESFTC